MSTDNVETMRAELEARGYCDAEHPRLRVEQRVRHRGEQWPEAYDQGTGVVLAVMEKSPSSWSGKYGQRDVELIVLKDRPLFEGGSRLVGLADYHVATVGGAR